MKIQTLVLTLAAVALVIAFMFTRLFLNDGEAIGFILYSSITTVVLLFSYELHATKAGAVLLCQIVIGCGVLGAVAMVFMDKVYLTPLFIVKLWFDLSFWNYVSMLERVETE